MIWLDLEEATECYCMERLITVSDTVKRSDTLENGQTVVERYTSPTKTLSGLLDLEVANG